jgi:hypothetical protein
VLPEELDRKFDNGEDVLEFFDTANAKRPGLTQQTLQLHLPQWMLEALETEAQRRAIAWARWR